MERVFLFDGSSLAYRAYYALKNKGFKTTKGFPTTAVYGFIRIFLKLLKDYKPEYLAVVFDAGKRTFRTKLMKSYKANRKPTPDEFKVQLPYIKRFLECLGVRVLEKEGYEADDIIGTLSKKFSKEGAQVVIVTPDKDMRQLIDENTVVVAISNKTGKSKTYDLKTFKEEYGIEPEQIPDVFGLSGDTIDNIPGVPGIGEKTALDLIRKFGSLENIYQNLDKLTPKRRELLEKFKEQAFLSRELARIKTDVPLDVTIKDLKLEKPNGDCLRELLSELEMRSVAVELKKLFPDLDFGKEIERGRELSEEELERYLSVGDLFTRPSVTVVPIDGKFLISTPKGFLKVDREKALEIVKKSGKIFTYNLKELYHSLGEEISKRDVEDLSLLYYLKNPLLKNYTPETLLKEFLESVDLSPIEDYIHYTFNLFEKLNSEVKKKGLSEIYKKMELPLSYVLYKMEKRGVLFDVSYLENLGGEIVDETESLKEKIYEEAGEVFNINSPKQLSYVLFEKLKLKPLKKTKSGYSTDVETLTTLALEGSRIAEYLLEYRKLTKLYGTFVKGILKHVGEDGRVHGKFLQTATATGRLSSVEPNLQNLPAFDEFSKKVRQAVTSSEGYTLVWADYSQIELRILAHLSGDEKLIEAFRTGRDIHTETARYLFGKEEIGEGERRIAKTVNFGIIYGMSPHGLSERLGIPIKEAEEYIENYFNQFPRVKEYIERTLKEAYEKGYVRTLFGRIRPLPELKDRSYQVRSFGERAAVNAIIQGTAADIMKLAMVELYRKLEEEDSYLILQVHDEVVIEVPEEKKDKVVQLVKETMENCINLSVPLTAKVESGKRWS
ncbi:DNA polymerase I [Balnearium lithotrophicum]|uniref:DNA polymerase I n=1 Tax=Balnearium lithotrophicum TaxID=223788 RepID=A0A521AAK2_9BACT|nr:DNA polymerase I [Balnearium lithotrophicum]SMO31750.1 DNA polymerase I [Balnearium lithotrophicum]